ncbi:hypothetical protein T4C_9722 [Trichinella pseudospiralis]|uniref:Uncharacterized protein n=1 Tax=Trichinella pseudospiralis TaxID=6337 RepID=A0A0V1JXZ5_TRIPS|nr:hypothetical protein T4C_9722 [Trichinella pseudospiralis]
MVSVCGDGVIFSMMGNKNDEGKVPLSSSNNPVHKLITLEHLGLQLHYLVADISIKQQAECFTSCYKKWQICKNSYLSARVPLTRYEAIAEP